MIAVLPATAQRLADRLTPQQARAALNAPQEGVLADTWLRELLTARAQEVGR